MSWSALGDWGTTRLRLFRLEEGRITGRVEGAGALSEDPAAILREALAPWARQSKPAYIHLTGMAGARGGLREAPYIDCPASAATWSRGGVSFTFDDMPTHIAPGLACIDRDGRTDLMRGEETQIFGALAHEPSLACSAHLFLLPGTHSKWIWVEEGCIVRMRTFITGELFALLQRSSLLAAKSDAEPQAEPLGFQAGLARAEETNPIGALFEARSAQLRAGRSVDWARGFISGLLIGAETADMSAHSERLGTVTLIGAPDLTARYVSALARRQIVAREMDGEDCVLAGLGLLDAHD